MVNSDKWRYGIVLDAGSSGTRLHIYRWLRNSLARVEGLGSHLPEIETKDKWTKKEHPGISTFGERPEYVGPDHLQKLLDHAKKYVPADLAQDTPIFLLATAGMRLLPDSQRNELLQRTCSYIRAETDFSIPDCDLHVQVIPGETEGLYGWVAANYLLGGFDSPKDHQHGKGHHTYGFLDMGGASAQIAFAPNTTEAEKHANDLKLLRLRTIDGTSQEYKVFVTTWLGFGANQARQRYVQALIASYGSEKLEMPDPCLHKGLKMSTNLNIIAEADTEALLHPYLLGTGDFEECMRRTLPLLEKDVPCLDEPCLFQGIHVPAIDFDVNHFIGISEYWHTTHEVFEMAHKDKSYDFKTYQERVKDFCSQDWPTIQQGISDGTWGKKVDEQIAYEVCFKSSWLISVLHDGIGIPRVGIESTPNTGHNGTKELLDSAAEKGYLDPFQAVNKIKSTEVSWTLGKMVLYASADVIAPEGALPVGYGSNEPGIPTDFQYPGGGLLQDVPLTSQSLTDRIKDTVLRSDSRHRVPGLLLFLFIVCIAVFYLFGRERRSRVYSSVFGSPGPSKRNGPFSSIFSRMLGRKGPIYDRVLEEGDHTLYHPDDFELDGLDSDDDDSKGNRTPRPKPIPRRLAPEQALDRRGLMVRTESRERLDTGVNSRRASPTRSKR